MVWPFKELFLKEDCMLRNGIVIAALCLVPAVASAGGPWAV